MDIEKLKQWLKLTREYQKNDFWTNIFANHTPEQFFKSEKDIPIYDIYKNDTHICVIVELPGVNEKDINISLDSNTRLRIKGIAKPLFPAEMDVKKERFYGNFERTILLPEPAEAKFVHVNYHQGLFQITYPRQF